MRSQRLPTLLGYVDLRNKVVVGDAMHTQRQISIQIGKAGGNYIWTVKGNQPQLLQDLQDWFDPKVDLLPGMGSPPKDFRSSTVTSKGHGRIEVRTLTTSSQLNDFLDWPFCNKYSNSNATSRFRKLEGCDMKLSTALPVYPQTCLSIPIIADASLLLEN